MALIVTPGAADADSYASVEDADAYHAARGNVAWDVAAADEKEQSLRRATAWLDGAYRGRWPGRRLNGRSQALDWPRSDALDAEGEEIGDDTIPDEIVSATCEAALREVASRGSLSPDVTIGTAKVLTGMKGITWAPLRGGVSKAADMAPTLVVVERLLSSIVKMGATTWVQRA